METLRQGDAVITLTGSAETASRLSQIAESQISSQQADFTSPVRVRRGALADGIPHTDLLLMDTHRLYLSGGLVPVRMLVNGRSIIRDASLRAFPVHRIKTARPAIIAANGVLVEACPALRPERAAAPLTIARQTVEPLFRAIEARAIQAGIESATPPPRLTQDADLHLLTDKGKVIRPAHGTGERVMFMIAADVGSVRIVSRASRPSEVIGPFIDDDRLLGVLISAITLFDSGHTRLIRDHMTNTSLEGWHDKESPFLRWTNGDALLPLGERRPNSVGMLSIQIVKAGPYRLPDETPWEETAAHSA